MGGSEGNVRDTNTRAERDARVTAGTKEVEEEWGRVI